MTTDVKMATDTDPFATWRYRQELPADKTNLAKAWELLESYSGIPPDEIDAHVIAVVSSRESSSHPKPHIPPISCSNPFPPPPP